MSQSLRFVPRPRRAFEALDLGLSLLQAHWAPVMRVFGLQLAILLALVLPFLWRHPVWVLLVLWWIAPWMGRGVLHVLSRAVFGQEAGVATFLGQWREIHRSGMLASLLWRRMSPASSFLLPLWQLEHQGGSGYRQRSRVLLRQSAAAAFLLAMTCLLFEALALFGVLGLLQMLVPRGLPLNLFEELGRGFDRPWFAWTFTAGGILAYALVEPFFAAAGFALYLNRRTELEAWDLERAFRNLAARIQAGLRHGALLLMLGLALGLMAGGTAMPLRAQAPAAPMDGPIDGPSDDSAEPPDPESLPLRPQDPARKQVEDVLARDPDFARSRTVHSYRYRPTGREPRWMRALLDALFGPSKAQEARPKAPGDMAWIKPLAWILKLVLVTGLVALALFLIYRFRHAWRGPVPKDESYVPPESVAGLDIRPESLPPDIPGEALLRFRAGDARGALALLYRGALAALVHTHRLEIPASATEGDCLRLAGRSPFGEGMLPALSELTQAWIRVAYLGEAPAMETMERLCSAWRETWREAWRKTGPKTGHEPFGGPR